MLDAVPDGQRVFFMTPLACPWEPSSQESAGPQINRQVTPSRGLALLEQHGLITTHAIGNAHRYRLSQFELIGWGKLPRAHLLDENRFRGLGLRGAAALNALKLYLALVAFRPNQARHVLLSYDRIEHYTGIPRPRQQLFLSRLA